MKYLITSFKNNDYYILNNKDMELFGLMTILTDNNQEEYADRLMDYWLRKKQYENKSKVEFPKLFISKTSPFGILLSELIQKKEIADESTIIRKEYVMNALINDIQANESNSLTETLLHLIQKEQTGSVKKLGKEYDINILKMIPVLGTKQDYLKELSSNLTGYEETGLIYQNQSWHVIDISTLNLIPLEDTEKKIKRKTRG